MFAVIPAIYSTTREYMGRVRLIRVRRCQPVATNDADMSCVCETPAGSSMLLWKGDFYVTTRERSSARGDTPDDLQAQINNAVTSVSTWRCTTSVKFWPLWIFTCSGKGILILKPKQIYQQTCSPLSDNSAGISYDSLIFALNTVFRTIKDAQKTYLLEREQGCTKKVLQTLNPSL